jgi:hypothetical protein
VRAARAGEPIDEYLAALAVRLDHAGAVPEPAHRGGTLPTRVADAGSRAQLGVHVCPRGVCARREQRAADAERPVCEVFDLALRFEAES